MLLYIFTVYIMYLYIIYIITNTYYRLFMVCIYICYIVRELLNFYEFPGDDIAIIKYVRITTSLSTSLTPSSS